MALLLWQVLNKVICIRNIKIVLYKIQMEMSVCRSTRKKNTGQGVRGRACIDNQGSNHTDITIYSMTLRGVL